METDNQPSSFARQTAVVIALILSLLVVVSFGPVERTGAARYVVAQCGWKVGNAGTWLETAAERFSRSSWCGVPAGSDPWDGVHMTSGTRPSTAAVGGTKFAMWRWTAPPGTGIVTVNGGRWHVLRDNFQHRIGSLATGGSFSPFLEYSATDKVRSEFARSFSPPAAAFESRLLCALPADRFCSVTGTSLVGVRGLTMTVNDPNAPKASIEGEFQKEGWLRGVQETSFSGSDAGSGVRLSETVVDGAVRGSTWHPCAIERIAGQWRGTKMQPCRTGAEGSETIDTAVLSDSRHRITSCVTDFAGNRACADEGELRSDNNPPAAPRLLEVIGGDDWRSGNSFALSWVNPDQGVAAPLVASRYRITGPGSFDSGTSGVSGIDGLSGLSVPTAGDYRVAVWLTDAAGNESPLATAEAALRFDDRDPVAFVLGPEAETPELLRATVFDEHSGPAGGVISYCRQGSDKWWDLPTRFVADGSQAELKADFPSEDLPPGRYDIRTRVRDHAGNEVDSDRRPDGTRLVLKAPLTEETRLEARLVGPGGSGRLLRVPFGATAKVVGRLVGENGQGITGRKVTIVQRSGSGTRSGPTARLVTTGPDGGFALGLPAGTSRRVTASFTGDRQNASSSTEPLRLGVIGSISFTARPARLRTGQAVQFQGRVRSGAARYPSRGNLVAIRYFEQSSRKWRPVLVTRTDRSGNYRASYRFRYITGVANIRLRATLLPSQGFPYLPADSRVRSVRVQG
ncbi:MAG: carboxypeptidase-like regulatory domain-containing protein [Solirubrobacterales bacterium]